MSTIEGIGAGECASPDEERLRDLAKEYSEARALAAEATDRKERLREQILALGGEATKVVAGSYLISVSAQTRTTLDHAALRVGAAQAGFDLTPFNKVTETKTLRVVG